MKRKTGVLIAVLTLVSTAGYLTFAKISKTRGLGFTAAASRPLTQGSLQIVDPEGGVVGMCPLKHTEVKAEISGFLARVIVTQEFENTLQEKIEAVYTFPLPQNAAVDDMTMRIGDRTVRGRIKPREEARAVYEAARAAGHVASLLDQERPNIFTQSVANITPGEKVSITISYVESLKYEDGTYEFVFPMVVGPRYIPGAKTGKQAGGMAHDTDRVPDASRITPQVAPPRTRAGHDISISVALDAGVPVDTLKSVLHEVDIERPTDHSAVVELKEKREIPNRDFILKYDVAGRRIEDALLFHRADPERGFFTFVLQPPERVAVDEVTPKELVFVLDTSGSMMGFPIEKAKETMNLALNALNPDDTFNLITFSGDTRILFPEPVPATRANLAKARAFLAAHEGSGGTEMMKAIRASLDPSDAADHLRVVCFMTDGYVGDDMEIIAEVQKHPNARVFAFGIGGSVNRFLLDKMAEQGRGEVEYVALNDDGSAAAKRFHERVRNPVLTDVSIDWGGLPVTDLFPARIPDLFSAKPVVVSGRYSGPASGTIKLKGKIAGRDFVREMRVDLPDNEPRHDVLATLWARAKVDEFMNQDYAGVQSGNPREDVRAAITQLGLDFRLMTQFTSFVAVEEMTVTDGEAPRKIEVPVELPEGVSRAGIFGEPEAMRANNQSSLAFSRGRLPAAELKAVPSPRARASIPPPPQPPPPRSRSGIGVGSGKDSGVGGGTAGNSGPRLGGGDLAKSPTLSQEELARRAALAKLHPSIASLVQRLKDKDKAPAADESKFVRDNKAEVQIWLTEKSDEVLAQLKKMGIEIIAEPAASKLILARIPIDKLSALSELTQVRYVTPIIRS